MKNMKEKMGELLAGESFSATTMSVLLIAVVLVANTVIYYVSMGGIFLYLTYRVYDRRRFG